MSSLSDVAKLAQVSRMTVSRVVNGEPRVSAETRERVQYAIDKLNYYPNATARALTRQKSMTIGLMIPGIVDLLSEPYFSQLVYHIENALIMHNYDTLIVSGDHPHGRDLTLLFKQKKIDGIIILGSSIDDPRLATLSENGNPTVLLHAQSNLPHINWVDVNNKSIIEYYIDYLTALGHRRIAFISGDLSVINGYQRCETYKSSMKKRDLPFEKEFIFCGDWSLRSGFEAFIHFNRLQPRPSAVIASNDHMAIGFLKAANEHQVPIPGAMSLVGIDDIQMASFTSPKLTTMRQPIGIIASMAVDTLIGTIDGEARPVSRIILDAEPVIRDSSGFCPGA